MAGGFDLELSKLISELRAVISVEKILSVSQQLLENKPYDVLLIGEEVLEDVYPQYNQAIEQLNHSFQDVFRRSIKKLMKSSVDLESNLGSLKSLRIFLKMLRQLEENDVNEEIFLNLFEDSTPTNDVTASNTDFYYYLDRQIKERHRLTIKNNSYKASKHNDRLVSSDTLRLAESELIKKYGYLDRSADQATDSLIDSLRQNHPM